MHEGTRLLVHGVPESLLDEFRRIKSGNLKGIGEERASVEILSVWRQFCAIFILFLPFAFCGH